MLRYHLAIALALFSTLSVRPALGKGVTGKLNVLEPDSERIMEVLLPDGTVLSSALVAYPYHGRWVLPLGQLADTLGLGISTWMTMLGAEGFIIDESRRFRLDVVQCEVLTEGKKVDYDCDEVIPFNDDVYVSDYLLQRWLPVDINVSPLASQVLLTPREILPAQARKKREDLAERAGATGPQDPGYPTYPIPYSPIQITALDEQLGANASIPSLPGLGIPITSVTSLTGELLGMGSYSTISMSGAQVTGLRSTFSRRSPTETFLGPLKIRSIQLLDIDVPTMPLVAISRGARGLALSSYKINEPSNFQNTDLQGPLQSGWEVLLFRNDILLDRRVGDETGYYRFPNVGLMYGRNTLRLVFFGPHGERREETRNFNIDSLHLPKGERDYRLVVGTDQGNPFTQLQYSQNLSERMTGLAGLSLEGDPRYRHFTLGFVDILDSLLLTGRFAISGQGGQAFELGAQTAVGKFNLGTKYTRLFNFRSRVFNDVGTVNRQTAQLEGNLSYQIPISLPLSLTSEFVTRTFADAPSDAVYRTRLTTMVSDVQLQTSVDYSPQDSTTPVVGRTEAFYAPYKLRFRAAADYSPRKLTALEGELQFLLSDRFQVNATTRFPLTDAPASISFQASRLFDALSLGALVLASPGGSTSINLQAAFSLVRENRTGALTMVRTPQTPLSAISLFAFLDENGNGRADTGEPGLPDLAFLACQHDDAVTGMNGIALVLGVRPQQPCDITTGESKNPNPFLRPSAAGFRVVPRQGITSRVDFPFMLVGQIDGTITYRSTSGDRPRRGIGLELVDQDGTVVAQTKSDSEGFYSFDTVRAGKSYVVRVAADQLARWNLGVRPESRSISMPREGSFESNADFLVIEGKEPPSQDSAASKQGRTEGNPAPEPPSPR